MLIQLYKNGEAIPLGFIDVHGNSSIAAIEKQVKRYNAMQKSESRKADAWAVYSPSATFVSGDADVVLGEIIKLS